MSLSTVSTRHSGKKSKTPVGFVADAGTGGLRGALFNAVTGEWLGTPVESSYAPTVTNDNPPHVLIDPAAGTNAMQRVLAELLKRVDTNTSRLVTVYIGGQMHAPFCLAEDGSTCFPVHAWNSAAGASDGAVFREILGWNVPDRASVCHLARFVHLEPIRFMQEVRIVTTQSGLLAAQLTGNTAWGLDPCDFSGMGFDDPETGQLSGKILEQFPFEIGALLPPRLSPNEFFGRVNDLGCHKFKIPVEWALGAAIAAPGGDQGCGRDGLGLLMKHVSVVLGTSVVLCTETHSRPHGTNFDPFRTAGGRCLNMALFANGMRNGDALLEQESKRAGQSKGEMLRLLGQEAAAARQDCGGAFAASFSVADPGLGVRRTLEIMPPSDLSRGEIWRLKWMQIGASIIRRLNDLVGSGPKPEVLVVGGAAAGDDHLLQCLADMVGVTFLRPQGATLAMLEGGKARAMLAEELANGRDDVDPDAFMRAARPEPSGAAFHPRPQMSGAFKVYLQRFDVALRQAS